MFLSIYFLLLLPILIVSIKSDTSYYCSNGRSSLWLFNQTTFQFSTGCSTSGQLCYKKIGICNEQNLCCPRTLKMSSKPRLYDRATNIKYLRIGDDYKNTYRLFELILINKNHRNFNNHFRWIFFDETLRDLFEMPYARFWYSIIDCLQNHGITYAFVPLNTTSVTTNISAMTILTRKKNLINSIYVCYIATKKEHRRQGLGTRLLQQIVHRALIEQKNGIKYIIMHVNTLNIVALELYEKCGWSCYEYLPGYLDREPHHATNHAYGLILHLDNVKNITGLCRDSNAIHINLLDDNISIQNCRRIPVRL